MKVTVKEKYTAQYNDPIKVDEGDELIKGKADDEYKGWIWCTSVKDGKSGWMPEEFIDEKESKYFCNSDYDAIELTVSRGDNLEKINEVNGWMFCEDENGRKGWVPANNIEQKMGTVTKVKICCIADIDEATAAINMGAYAIGLVSSMPSGPGVIDDDKIKEIASNVPKEILTFLLTSRTDAKGIIEQCKAAGTNTLQIVDELSEGAYKEIREALPDVKLVQVIHVIDEGSIEEAVKVSSGVDALLLDSGNPKLEVKELGGTGRVHNWELSRKIRESVSIRVYLAGGLNALNVKKAIETVEPFGVDLCSGVRTNGKLDMIKLESFFKEVNRN